MKDEILTIIPARSGSKGIKNKNIKPINGKPLIYWTIKEAIKSKLKNVIVSTDSKKISKISKKYGADVPFIRPKNISRDDTKMKDVLKHALNFFSKEKKFFKYILILQPTSPLRTFKDIQKAIKLIKKHKKATSIVSVVQVEDNHPSRMYYLNKLYLKKNLLSEKKTGIIRQNLKKMYLRNGAIYLIKTKNINSMLGNKPMAYIMSEQKSINIDRMFDFKIAEYLFKKTKFS